MFKTEALTGAKFNDFARRLVLITFGLGVFALGIVFTYRSAMGLGPWDVLHQGLSHHLPLTLGNATIAVSLSLIVISYFLGIKPGLGTLLNGTLIGIFVDLINNSPLAPQLPADNLALRIIVDVAGVMITGLGTALYIKAQLGAGPRDSLMLALRDRLRIRVGMARAGVELTALFFGWLLGGTIGIGTLIFALGIGPAVELSFHLVRVKGKSWQPSASK